MLLHAPLKAIRNPVESDQRSRVIPESGFLQTDV
jgi:hypothetical protein